MAVPVKDLIKFFENPNKPVFIPEKDTQVGNFKDEKNMVAENQNITRPSKDTVKDQEKVQKDPNIALKNSLKQIAENVLRRKRK